MSVRIFLVLMSVILILAACQEEVLLAPVKTGSVADFPNAFGLQFGYQVLDNLQAPIDPNKPFLIIDTIESVITGVATDPLTGVEATVWAYQLNRQPLPSRPVVFKGDTVYMYWNWENADKIGIVFPFAYGDSWATGGILSGDRTTVIDTTSVSSALGNFKNVYILENVRRTTVSTDKRTITMWFVPKFGIIKINVHEEHAAAEGDTTWTLFRHNNPAF